MAKQAFGLRGPIRRSRIETTEEKWLLDRLGATQLTQGLWVPAFAGTTGCRVGAGGRQQTLMSTPKLKDFRRIVFKDGSSLFIDQRPGAAKKARLQARAN